ncbi:unnamed protein product [Arabidopsis thaliana]|uniref:Uncharacterized protein n=1 Tax=Arabidopsis thaliana TaxID=3702 RepID=A0A654EUW2_ARATH|nr:unnamed protein product [Arabidopsis thaliana]VYS53069.1 unnamed protein product [Arabidopsis thaliana]
MEYRTLLFRAKRIVSEPLGYLISSTIGSWNPSFFARCKHYSQDDTENFESDEYRENQESSRVKPDSPVNYQTYLQYREMRGNAGARCVAQVETENGPRSDRTEFQRWII